MKKESSPLTDVMEFYGVKMTLTEWLASNEATDIFDAELLESLPAEFHDEYLDRLRLHNEYETKFAGRGRKTLVPVGRPDSRQRSHIVELKNGEA